MLTKCKIKKIYYSKMTADLVYVANPPPTPPPAPPPLKLL